MIRHRVRHGVGVGPQLLSTKQDRRRTAAVFNCRKKVRRSESVVDNHGPSLNQLWGWVMDDPV